MPPADPPPASQVSASQVDDELVRRVASLARLELGEDELRDQAARFREILAAFRTLDEVDVEGAPEMIRVARGPRLRPDVPRPSLAAEDVLANAPAREDGFYRVPRTVGEEP